MLCCFLKNPAKCRLDMDAKQMLSWYCHFTPLMSHNSLRQLAIYSTGLDSSLASIGICQALTDYIYYFFKQKEDKDICAKTEYIAQGLTGVAL